MLNMFIDTHSHIYEEEFREDRDATVQRALEANVKRIVLPDIDRESRRTNVSTGNVITPT